MHELYGKKCGESSDQWNADLWDDRNSPQSLPALVNRVVDCVFRFFESDEWAAAEDAQEAAAVWVILAIHRYGEEAAAIAIEDERDRRWLARYGVEWGADA